MACLLSLAIFCVSFWMVGFYQSVQAIDVPMLKENQNDSHNNKHYIHPNWQRFGQPFNQSLKKYMGELSQTWTSQPKFLERDVCNFYAGNNGSVHSILNRIHQLEQPICKLTGYRALFEAFNESSQQHTSEMMMLAYYIRQEMQQPAIEKSMLQEYEDLKHALPTSIRKIIFASNVYVKNRERSEYIYMSEYSSVRGKLLGWKKGGRVANGRFSTETTMVNGILYSYLRQGLDYNTQETICPDTKYEDGDNDRYLVKSCGLEVAERSQWWIVTPVGSDYYTIKHTDGYYLYSPDDKWSFDKDRRYTFTWHGSPLDMSNNYKAHWLFED